MSDKRTRRMLDNLALIAADAPKVANYRVSAAITYKNRLVSYGISSYKTSPFQKRFAADEYKIHLHAEIAAIKNALRTLHVSQLKNVTLYVCRVKSLGEWGNSKPCPGCQRAIAEFGIKNVIYTSADSDYTKL